MTRCRVLPLALLWGCTSEDPGATDADDRGTTETGTPVVGEPPAVLSVTPADGAVDVPLDATVVITFSEPVDPASGLAVLSHDAVACTHEWNATGDVLTLVPDQPLGALVDYQVEVSGFVDADGRPMEETVLTSFQTAIVDRLVAKPPSGATGVPWSFAEVGEAAGITQDHFWWDRPFAPRHPLVAGGTVGDYDDDGYIDIFIGRGDAGATHLFRNLGDGTFEDVSAQAGVSLDDVTSVDPTFVDFDGDGDLDLFIPAFDNVRTRFFLNDGDGTFTDDTDHIGIVLNGKDWWLDTYSSTWADYDLDGDLDVFMARFAPKNPGDPRFLYRNNGDGTYTDVSLEAELFALDIVQSFTANFADTNDDGYPDLLIACDHGYSVYLLNDGDGTFSRQSVAPAQPVPPFGVDPEEVVVLSDENGMGAAVSDYDNDGDLDWFVGAIYDDDGVSEHRWGVEGNRLYQNDGTGYLEDVSEDMGLRDGKWAWGTCSADFDLDGNEDFFQVNGMTDDRDDNVQFPETPSALFRNNADGTFTDLALDLGITLERQGRGVSCFDYDRDGDVDILEVNWMAPPNLYRNDMAEPGRFLNVRLDGRSPNTHGIGARVYVKIGDVTQMREVSLASNYNSHDPVEEVFGLGDATVIDELRVVWPDGTENVAKDVPGDRFVLVSQPPAP